MKKVLVADISRYLGVKFTFWSILVLFLKNQAFRFHLVLRLAQIRKGKLDYLFWRLLLLRLKANTSIQISPRTEIGKGFSIGHAGTIVVAEQVRFGNHCTITHGVTIGGAGKNRKKGFPKIGNRVWIGTNAVVVGDVTIGNDVLIAPGAYVNRDIPDNSLVLGNPGMIKSIDRASKDYIHNIVN